jgi:beta-lactamase class A
MRPPRAPARGTLRVSPTHSAAARRARALLAATLLWAAGAGAPAAAAQPPSGLTRLLADQAARFPGSIGVYVKHLVTGEEAAIRADDAFNSASVIKLPVLALAMQMVDRGTLSLDTRLTVTEAAKRGGSGILQRFDAGLQPTLRDVLAQMVITSDNTATDLAIAQVGGVAAVNAWIAANGGGMTLLYTVAEVFASVRTPGYTANPRAAVAGNRAHWLGSLTPRAVGTLLERMQRCADGSATGTPLATRPRCEEMMRMMRQQLSGDRRLPHYLDVPVAHKTGDWPPYLANDVGVIFARSGPIVVVVCTNDIRGNYGEAEDRIGEMARTVVAYFDGR